jgi:hypothetical protein
MFASRLENSLSQVEQLLEDVSAALLSGEPLVLEATSSALRQAVVGLSGLLQGPAASARLDQMLRQRLARVSLTLSQQRSNLLRRAVMVDRALAAVLPQAAQAQTYGNGAKASTYRGGAARIYAAMAT